MTIFNMASTGTRSRIQEFRGLGRQELLSGL